MMSEKKAVVVLVAFVIVVLVSVGGLCCTFLGAPTHPSFLLLVDPRGEYECLWSNETDAVFVAPNGRRRLVAIDGIQCSFKAGGNYRLEGGGFFGVRFIPLGPKSPE